MAYQFTVLQMCINLRLALALVTAAVDLIVGGECVQKMRLGSGDCIISVYTM